MMNFIEIAKKRYSVRNYSGKKVEKEKLDMVINSIPSKVVNTRANSAILKILKSSCSATFYKQKRL